MARVNLPSVEDLCIEIEAGATFAELAEKYGCSVGSVHRKLNATPEAAEQSARALSFSAEAWLDRGIGYLQSAMSKSGDIDPTAAKALAQECARRAAIRNPRYRDRSSTEISGPNGGPVQVQGVEWLVKG